MACLLVACDGAPGGGQSTGAEPTEGVAIVGSAQGGGQPALPGIAQVDAALVSRLGVALEGRGPGYEPRTHHLSPDGKPRYTNRLILQSSPYLLQHAHNPVNWFPWSEEAFERARREGKPVFLSVGYSTCHWCHVMEVESFEDEEIAAYLNQHYVAVKVDREQRPDVDEVYMTAVQLMAGRGGWPMTVLMTPEREPFFGATYIPPRTGTRGAREGLLEILKRFQREFSQGRETLVARGRALTKKMLARAAPSPGDAVPDASVVRATVSSLSRRFDRVHGGFGRAPKFPQPGRLALLLQYLRRNPDARVRGMLRTTLDRMARGGMYDQVGGGFHRYSTDARWLVPHFEKMLYDNALLARVYVDAYACYGVAEDRRVATEVLDYVVREMQSSKGGFYSATDADSLGPGGHMEEGYYFTWTPEELKALLDEQQVALVSEVYAVRPGGNFEGRNILHQPRSRPEMASKLGISEDALQARLRPALARLYRARQTRPAPLRDDKILTAWNGLMIGAFARAARVLDRSDYLERARAAAGFVLTGNRRSDGRLRRVYPAAGDVAFLDDYAYLIHGLLALYEASGEFVWLEHATELQKQQDQYFRSPDGSYFQTASDSESLLVRSRPEFDGAVPSGNSISALNLQQLATIRADGSAREQAGQLLASLARPLRGGSPLLVAALDRYLDIPLEVAVVSPAGQRPPASLLAPLRRSLLPGSIALVLDEKQMRDHVAALPWLRGKRAMGGKPTAYVCELGRCELPTADPLEFARQLRQFQPLR